MAMLDDIRALFAAGTREPTPAIRDLLDRFLTALEAGELRAAERGPDGFKVVVSQYLEILFIHKQMKIFQLILVKLLWGRQFLLLETQLN